ncbi:MAG TPA: MFS transporter [Clostridiales bacterium]|nr:MFS transporter [Clostridiales bacterium]
MRIGNGFQSRPEVRLPEAGTPLWNRYFCLIAAVACSVNFGNFFLGSSMSLWVVDMGGSNTSYGTIHSLYSLVVLLARLLTGWIIDHGNRKKAFVLSSIVFASAMGLMLVSPVFGIFIVMRLIQGAGNGCAITICNTSAYDYMPPDKMDKGIGYITLFSSLVSALTATISVSVYNRKGPSAIVLWSVVSIAIGIILSTLVSFRVPIDRRPCRLKEVINLSQLFEKRSVKPAILAAFSVNFGFGLRSYVILYGRSIGIANPGWFTSVSAIGLIVVRLILNAATVDKIPRKKLIYLGYGVFIVYFILLAFCKNIYMYLGAALLWSVVYGILTPQLQSMAVQAAPEARRGAAASTFFCASDIGIILGSLCGGMVADVVGYGNMFLFALVPLVICILFYTFFM